MDQLLGTPLMFKEKAFSQFVLWLNFIYGFFHHEYGTLKEHPNMQQDVSFLFWVAFINPLGLAENEEPNIIFKMVLFRFLFGHNGTIRF